MCSCYDSYVGGVLMKPDRWSELQRKAYKYKRRGAIEGELADNLLECLGEIRVLQRKKEKPEVCSECKGTGYLGFDTDDLHHCIWCE